MERCVAFGSGFFHSAGGVESACLRGYFQPEAPPNASCAHR